MDNLVMGENPFVKKMRNLSMAAILVGIVLVAVTFVIDSDNLKLYERVFGSYVVAWVFFTGIALTGIFFSALQFLTRSGWSGLVRRIAEFFTPFLLVSAVGSIPVILDVLMNHGHLGNYHWADPKYVENDVILYGKSAYLNPTFFVVRIIGYYVLWAIMHKIIVGNSYKQDDAGADTTPTMRNRVLAAPMIVIYALTFSFFGFDIVMSMNAHWFSTIFGVYVFAGAFVATLSLLTILVIKLSKAGLMPQINGEHYHILAKLVFAFNVFWAYIGFSQYFLYWYGNIPEEYEYFAHRLDNGWEWFGFALIIGHFIIPFVLLIAQPTKRKVGLLLNTCYLLLAMCFVDLMWYVLPNTQHHANFDITSEVGFMAIIGGIFFIMLSTQFAKRKFIAFNDPLMVESVELHN